MVKYKKV